MKTGAPGRAPGRPALPSSQTGRRLAVRPARSPGDGPASGRPGRGGGPCRSCAWMADDRFAGGAGGRRWGRTALLRVPRTAGEPPPGRVRDRVLPLPASRTPVPFPRHRAPAREASACSIGGSSARGTCVRKGRVGVGRNGCQQPGMRPGIWLKTAQKCGFALQRILHEAARRPRAWGARTGRAPWVRTAARLGARTCRAIWVPAPDARASGP
jgi:hypothetical protein